MSLAAAALLLVAGAEGGALTVRVANVRNDIGHVHVALCRRAQFLGEACAFERSVPARAGVTSITFDNVPSGEWAAQAFHDENDNHQVDQVLFGIPKEGVGFSRDAPIRMAPPQWREASFAHDGKAQSIEFALRYFLGEKGPREWARAHSR